MRALAELLVGLRLRPNRNGDVRRSYARRQLDADEQRGLVDGPETGLGWIDFTLSSQRDR
jgi:hypothetical protein